MCRPPHGRAPLCGGAGGEQWKAAEAKRRWRGAGLLEGRAERRRVVQGGVERLWAQAALSPGSQVQKKTARGGGDTDTADWVRAFTGECLTNFSAIWRTSRGQVAE